MTVDKSTAMVLEGKEGRKEGRKELGEKSLQSLGI